MKIVLAENFRTVFYAPFYAAYARGDFKRLGVDISFVESPTPGSAITQMYAGQVDVVWGGPLRAIKLRDENAPEEQALVAFGEVVGKDPFFLVSAKPYTDFKLSDVMSVKLGVVSEVPTPWLCLQEDFRDHGLDPTQIAIVADKTMQENLDALNSGTLDMIQVFEPFVSLAEQQGHHIVYASADRGMTAYTTFLSTAASIAKNRAAFQSMTSAIENIRVWINSAAADEIISTIKDFYPHLDSNTLKMCINRYQKMGLWTCQRQVSKQGFIRLRQSMYNGGFITTLPEYESCTLAL